MDFIRRLNRENFYFSSQRFQIWWQISGIEVRKTQTFISVSQKLCLLGQKKTGTWNVNNTIVNPCKIYVYINNKAVILLLMAICKKKSI